MILEVGMQIAQLGEGMQVELGIDMLWRLSEERPRQIEGLVTEISAGSRFDGAHLEKHLLRQAFVAELLQISVRQ